jgi:hypothetical protein
MMKGTKPEISIMPTKAPDCEIPQGSLNEPRLEMKSTTTSFCVLFEDEIFESKSGRQSDFRKSYEWSPPRWIPSGYGQGIKDPEGHGMLGRCQESTWK